MSEKKKDCCYSCVNWPICKVREQVNVLVGSMASITEDTIHRDLHEFVASKCRLFSEEEK